MDEMAKLFPTVIYRVVGIADFTRPQPSENAYKLWFNWTVRAAVVQSHHLNSQICVLAGSLVYDTGFPFQSGNSREPGFESRRPHHDFVFSFSPAQHTIRVKAYNLLPR